MTDDLESFRFVTSADVYVGEHRAAVLDRGERGTVNFAYLPDYLARVDARPVATTLPLGGEPITTTGGALPAFFTGLLPEGRRLSALQRSLKTSADDELSLLLAVGEDTPGDVRVVRTGAPAGSASALVDLTADDVDFGTITGVIDRYALPGVQEKVSASRLTLPVRSDTGHFILKLAPLQDLPNIVANEAAHLRAAAGLRLPVASARIGDDAGGRTGLLVRRFDRLLEGDRWTRLAVEDATQVMDLPPADKYRPAAEEVAVALAKPCRAPAVALRALYLQFVFAWLVGNGDLHAKNLSILRAPTGVWSVAPIYDVLCTLPYGDNSMALPVDGATRRLRARHWLAFAETIGLPRRAAESAHRVALRAASGIDLAAQGFAGSPLRGAQRELRLRRAELS